MIIFTKECGEGYSFVLWRVLSFMHDVSWWWLGCFWYLSMMVLSGGLLMDCSAW